MPVKKAAFLDRDGTIIKEVDYLSHPDQIQLLPGASEAIKMLNQAGILVLVASNQSGVARGFFDEKTVRDIHSELMSILRKEGAHLDAVYYCPHHPEGNPPYNIRCKCRKPEPGMILKAAEEFPINIRESVIIGDKISDIQTGQRLQMKSILVRTGYGEQQAVLLRQKQLPDADYFAENLLDAVSWWLKTT